MATDQDKVLVDEEGCAEANALYAFGDLANLSAGMIARIARIRVFLRPATRPFEPWSRSKKALSRARL